VRENRLVQSSRWSRPLLLLERTMYREGHTPFTSVFTVKVAGELDEGQLRQALARVQAKHPLLRCFIEEAAGSPASLLLDRPAPIPLRIVERRRDDDWQTEARASGWRPSTQAASRWCGWCGCAPARSTNCCWPVITASATVTPVSILSANA